MSKRKKKLHTRGGGARCAATGRLAGAGGCDLCCGRLGEERSVMYLTAKHPSVPATVITGHIACVEAFQRELIAQHPHLAAIHEHREYDDNEAFSRDVGRLVDELGGSS
jgi:hypothetical protein